MVRWLVNIGLTIVANAIGLIVAAAVLDDMSLGASGFVIAVLIFTAAFLIIRPLIVKMTLQHAATLGGSSALLATLVALIITRLISDSLEIRGFATWVLATVIVWVVALIGGVLLPWLILKRVIKGPDSTDTTSRVTTWR